MEKYCFYTLDMGGLTSWINLHFPLKINFAVTRCSGNTWNRGYKQLRSVPCCGLGNNKYCLRSIIQNCNNQVKFICVNKYKVGCGVKFWQLIFTTIKTSQTCFVNMTLIMKLLVNHCVWYFKSIIINNSAKHCGLWQQDYDRLVENF